MENYVNMLIILVLFLVIIKEDNMLELENNYISFLFLALVGFITVFQNLLIGFLLCILYLKESRVLF